VGGSSHSFLLIVGVDSNEIPWFCHLTCVHSVPDPGDRWVWSIGGKTTWGKYLSQCHFVHYEFPISNSGFQLRSPMMRTISMYYERGTRTLRFQVRSIERLGKKLIQSHN